jgi:Hint domain-containing protein
MKAGFPGAFVICWSQCELDGLRGAPFAALAAGVAWRWSGEALCLDRRRDILRLEGAVEVTELHRHAAQKVKRILGGAGNSPLNSAAPEPLDRLFDGGFDITDGQRHYHVQVIELSPGVPPLLVFENAVPPVDTDFWVVNRYGRVKRSGAPVHSPRGVICFTPGTWIATPSGPCLVQDLQEGDRVSTKDNGAQEIRWIGQRRLSGARLYAMPHLRPVRLRAAALGQGEPDQDLLLSPQHRLLVRGDFARALFNTDEVLVAAGDLVNDRTVLVDRRVRDITYIHLMLEAHQIVWANGVECESFHPASADMAQLLPDQLGRMEALFPGVSATPHSYGAWARRTLSRAEAAIMAFEM